MKPTLQLLSASALGLAAVTSATAQYAPPPPTQPFPGFLNEYLRKDNPYMNAWDIGGSVRLRYEMKDGGGFTGPPGSGTDFRRNLAPGTDNINSYFMDKVRVRLGYTDKWWSAFVEGRSSSTSGDDRNPNAESDGILELHQAYVTVGNSKEFPLSLKVGRQEMVYGEERLIGVSAWNNLSRVFDAAKLRWQNEYFAADFFSSRVVLPRDNHFNIPNDYDWFSGMYATSKLIPKNSLDFYFLSRNTSAGSLQEQTTTTAPSLVTGRSTSGVGPRDIYSVGLRLKSNPEDWGNWDYSAEVIGQFGHFNDAAAPVATRSQEVQAYAWILQGGYTWKDTAWKPRLGIEYSHGSGDNNPTDTKHKTFENLFPTNHKFYGYMDFVSLQNIHDVRLSYSLKPTAKTSVSLEGHSFWLANTSDSFYNVGGARRGGIGTTAGAGYGINPGYSSYVGSEIDLIAGYTPTKYLSFEAGYGHFFRGSYVRSTFSSVGSRDADFIYLQSTLTF